MELNLSKINSIEIWQLICHSINENNFHTFNLCLNEIFLKESALLRPRLINDAINECQKNEINGCEFLELLLNKLYGHCYYECWQETCKSIVRLYILKRKQFTPHSIYFLLRCYDVDLIRLVFEYELLDEFCEGNCIDWHLMFVASYQERFFAHCFDNILEGFLSRYLLLNKLRCSLNQKRTFLTWFAGSLHLYYDDHHFTNKDENRFQIVLIKVFEGLILNGLLNNDEYKNLYDMFIKRNKEILTNIQELNAFPTVNTFYPLTLKNLCRLNIKRNLVKYTRKCIDSLPLPKNLKRFILFDNECDFVFKFYTLNNLENLSIKNCETQTDL